MPNTDTGGGASFSFATSTLTGHCLSISAIDVEGKAVDVTHLLSNWDEFIPGDTLSISEVTIRYLFDAKGSWLAPKTKDTLTITLPEITSAGAPAALTGTGFVMKNRIIPELAINTEQVGELVWKFDGGTNGGTVPTFTAETDA